MPSTVYRNIKKRGAGIGTGGVYRGRRTQRGHGGLGEVVGKILKGGKKILVPILKKGGKAVANIGKQQAADLVKQGARKAAEYAVKNKGNIAKSVAGTVGATVIGAVGDRIANKKQETRKVKAAVKQAKKADNQIKQGLKRKAQAIEKIEEATTKPPAKRRRKKRGRGLDSIF